MALFNWFRKESKSVIRVGFFDETTREGIHKAFIPKFLYKPPFGYPRFVNIPYIRWLATTPYVEMCIKTILDEISAIEWDIISTEGFEDQAKDAEVEHIVNLFKNPNTNKESFEEVFVRRLGRDILEINSGILNKIFNMKEELVEVVARDGGTFTKNPDIHGMYTDREDIILPERLVKDQDAGLALSNPWQNITHSMAREQAAYFQYGWIAGPVPIPFGKREIIWFEQNPRTDEHYGYSPVQILAKSLQMLIYMVESDLEYYIDNNIPKGFIGLDSGDADELKAFRDQWTDIQRTKDEFGNWKKQMNKVPILNSSPKFERIEFSASEMQIIEKQKWYSKMVWACFGVTATELGYTEDAKGVSNQIVQSKVFKKKAVYPLLRTYEYKFTKEIISEFGYVINQGGIEISKYRFKFKTFDVDEEKNKFELYKLQVDSGIKTANEIRVLEGLDEKEGGDDLHKKMSFTGEGFNPWGDKEEDAVNADQKEDTAKEPKLRKKEEKEKVMREKEKKALTEENPLILKEHEEISSYKRLTKAIKKVLFDNEDKLKKLIEGEMKDQTIKNIKSSIESKPFAGYSSFKDCISKNQDKGDPAAYCAVIMRKVEGKAISDVIKILKSFLEFEGLKPITNAIVRNNFLKGWDEAEVDLGINLKVNDDALIFLQNYTFNNIKGMTTDLESKLRGILERSIINNDNIADVKSKISDAFDVTINRAEAIARTETIRSFNQGSLQAMKKSGKKMTKTWLAHIDDRTSDICKRLDGQVVDINEKFKDPLTKEEFDAPPALPNCRSRLIYNIS